MIVDELAARFSFAIQGLEKVRRAIDIFTRLTRAVAAFAATVAKRLGRVAGILARASIAAAGFGTAFVAGSAMITAAAATVTAGLAAMAAGFARLKKTTIDSAFVNGVPIKELALVENVMKRLGASAKDGRQFISEFNEKLREGIKDGGDWADSLAKAGVKIKGAKGAAKAYSTVIDDVLKAADKIVDPEKKRSFLKDALAGAPDELMASLLQSTSAVEKWKTLVAESRKLGGKTTDNDILNVGDITSAMSKMQLALQGFADAFGSGLMASFAGNFRDLGAAIMNVANDENREKIRALGSSLADFSKDIVRGGATVLETVANGIRSLMSALSSVDAATGGVLGQVAKGLFALGAALLLVAAGPSVAISAAITGLLFAVAKFQEWKEGGKNALSDFFDAISDAATAAKTAITNLIDIVKSFPGIGNMSPAAPADGGPEGASKTRRNTILDGVDKLDQLRKQRLEQNRSHREGGTAPAPAPAAPQSNAAPGFLDMLRSMFRATAEMSPERQVQKVAADRAAANETDNRKYENIGNDQRTISPSITVQASGLEAVANAVQNSVLGAISTKGANTSTGALTAP